MYRRSPLRFLAPVVLIAFGVAFLLVVKSYEHDEGPKAPSANEQAKERDLGTAKNTNAKSGGNKDQLPKKYYRVKAGDSLGSIAQATGIPVEKLTELNPKLDAQSLQTGQLVKLRE